MRLLSIEEIKKIELDILVFFSEYCEKNGLTYFLSGGTMLGAMRHQGFIPWDDDIDVMMPRNDYDDFVKNFPEHPYYKIANSNTNSNYPVAYSTLNDIRTFKHELLLRNRCANALSVNIDIFPIDKVPNEVHKREAYFKEIWKMGNRLQCATKHFGKGQTLFSSIKKNLGIFIYRISEVFLGNSVNKVVKEFEKLSIKYNEDITDYCGITSIAHYGTREVCIISDYLPVKKVIFEGHLFNVPSNYDSYLRNLYGDYMIIPPKDKQITHHTSKSYALYDE